ncbi:hypothetical protein Pla123a_20480 [Posidoniimonas polymericola]|uniref:Uncharacterized protein n=1 Tax=Posidoniimonas polymericola TaxID=2528002 RepID=A0A5C5YRP3_9BACT|nr:hypothetical protein [Posidoniimonas polymericola]TWT77387.1 hypothetical protein Pla123a_20480 [Posidoniimonas polymericola]
MPRSLDINPYQSPRTQSDFRPSWLGRLRMPPWDKSAPRPAGNEPVLVLSAVPILFAGYVTALMISNCLRLAGLLDPAHPWCVWASRLVYPLTSLERALSDPGLMYANLLAGAVVWSVAWLVALLTVAFLWQPRVT